MGADNDYGLADADITWYNPDSYPSRVTPAISLAVARELLTGADFRFACMKLGIALGTANQWMKWGATAAANHANSSDIHAPYLDFYLKVSQALGITGVKAQQQIFREAPGWWISHHPQFRISWGTQAIPDTALEEVTPTTESGPVALPPPSASDMRQIIQRMLESGVMTKKDTTETTIDADDAGDSAKTA